MKKVSALIIGVLLVGLMSCRDTKKEQEQLDANLDKIEAVEQDIDDTVEEVEQKAEEVEAALIELDSL